MKYEIITTDIFTKWVKKLKDRRAVRAIAQRIDRALLGNLGDTKSVGEDVMEMRLFIGKGYRLYFTERNGRLIILLCGGDKSTQSADIKRAKLLAHDLENPNDN